MTVNAHTGHRMLRVGNDTIQTLREITPAGFGLLINRRTTQENRTLVTGSQTSGSRAVATAMLLLLAMANLGGSEIAEYKCPTAEFVTVLIGIGSASTMSSATPAALIWLGNQSRRKNTREYKTTTLHPITSLTSTLKLSKRARQRSGCPPSLRTQKTERRRAQ